jgi:hypothetical protein
MHGGLAARKRNPKGSKCLEFPEAFLQYFHRHGLADFVIFGAISAG